VCGGSSVATSRVAESHELPQAVAAARAEDTDDRALVESLVRGREVTATVLRHDGRVCCLPLVSIEPSSQDAFYTYHAKYESEATRFTCPAALPDATRVEAERLSVALYEALELRGVVRLDFIVPDEDPDAGAPVFLEVNTLPGFTTHSLVPMAAESAGMTRLAVLESLLRDAAP